MAAIIAQKKLILGVNDKMTLDGDKLPSPHHLGREEIGNFFQAEKRTSNRGTKSNRYSGGASSTEEHIKFHTDR